ncbi:ABC transporter permease subunit [Paenibacillus glycanilyticus]|uniref:ABC transporter permease n=1 Tax=Paenibacillus glycanilyticus TaxID=126569 RepID=UPI00203BE18C|nr:ABC transporter permease subunit [Paenibacillus glycanilyticus]MCM3626274.1 ABC transporter permease subunit [Paenibacillus glycanilyticus]
MNTIAAPNTKRSIGSVRRKTLTWIWKYRYLHLLALPCMLYFLIFKYIPMYGIIIAFKDYKGIGGFEGIISSDWAGFKNFHMFFDSIYFWRLMRNTLMLSLYLLIFAFPAPIILALLINEARGMWFKKAVQSISYMPHFLSWVVCAGLVLQLLTPTGGPVNALMEMMGKEPIAFTSDPGYFRTILVLTNIWKEVGWGTIIYLAAMASIDPELYEASTMDGAKKWHKMLYITLPGIKEIVAIMLILSMGNILDGHFEQVFNLYSPAVYEVADNFDTYVYRIGLVEAKFAYSAAVGLFKSVVALVLVVLANRAAKRLGSDGLW